MNKRVVHEAKGWHMALESVKAGPNDYARGDHVHFQPPSGSRFLWFTIRLKNVESTPKTFNWDRCDVDSGEDVLLPALVDTDALINIEAGKEEELSPGQELGRRLAFAYPDHKLPTRLACGELVFPLQLQ